MPHRNILSINELIKAMSEAAASGSGQVPLAAILERTHFSETTARRLLAELIEGGVVAVQGKARATRYSLLRDPRNSMPHDDEASASSSGSRWNIRAIPWSDDAVALLKKLEAPLHTRTPIAYRRDFLDDYVPGTSTMLPAAIAEDLLARGRLPDQQPAGTYARKVLEQLLVELSWSSSKLEGNTYSLLDTERLFQQGGDGSDPDASMLLNHKHAIEFLVEEGPIRGLTTGTVRNVHALLMVDLLKDEHLGAIRETPVYITGSTFVPVRIAHVVDELLEQMIDKARRIPNPIEAAYFLWIQLAYLQPFVDGNKRTSRLAANIPLTLYNCSPLAFMDVDRKDYALAMMGVYEFNDLSIARDIFQWTYERSILRYKAVVQAKGAPDPVAIRFREALTAAVGRIVGGGESMDQAVRALELSAEDEALFVALLSERLDFLQPFNSARFRLSEQRTSEWIQAGRPR